MLQTTRVATRFDPSQPRKKRKHTVTHTAHYDATKRWLHRHQPYNVWKTCSTSTQIASCDGLSWRFLWAEVVGRMEKQKMQGWALINIQFSARFLATDALEWTWLAGLRNPLPWRIKHGINALTAQLTCVRKNHWWHARNGKNKPACFHHLALFDLSSGGDVDALDA